MLVLDGAQMDKRDPEDPCFYLLAIWNSGKASSFLVLVCMFSRIVLFGVDSVTVVHACRRSSGSLAQNQR
jgi:hypothetical protein